MSDEKCIRCKSSLDGGAVVPHSLYSLIYCPRCGAVNERGDAEEMEGGE